MKVKVITIATRQDHGLNMLISTLKTHGYDYAILCMGQRWLGFGMKVIETIKYLEHIKDNYTHFIFIDAYDVIFLDNLATILDTYNKYYKDEVIFSTEKACWPVAELSSKYPDNPSLWKYLNSGSYMGPITKFLDLVREKPVTNTYDDQLYFTELFFNGGIILDYECRIFQSIAFNGENEFTYSIPFKNNITNTNPVIIHGNGKTDMSKVLTLI